MKKDEDLKRSGVLTALASLVLTALAPLATGASEPATLAWSPAAQERRASMSQLFTWHMWFRAQNLHRDREVLRPEDLDEAVDLFARINFYTDEESGEIRVFVPGRMGYSTPAGLVERAKLPPVSDPAEPIVLKRRDLRAPERLAAAGELVDRAREFAPPGALRSRLDDAARERLAELVVFYDLTLVGHIRRFAAWRGISTIEPNNVGFVASMLIYRTTVDGWTSGLEFGRRAFAQQMSLVYSKVREVHSTHGSLDAEGLRRSESEIAGRPLTAEASQHLRGLLTGLAHRLWSGVRQKHPRGERVMLGEHEVYEAVEEVLPYAFDADGNATYFPESDDAIVVESFDVEAFQETAAGWEIMIDLLWEHGETGATEPTAESILPADYTANEEIHDLISTYGALLLVEAGRAADFEGLDDLDTETLEATHKALLSKGRRHVEGRGDSIAEGPLIFADATAAAGIRPFDNPYEIDSPETLREGPPLMAHDAFRGVSTADVDGDHLPDLFIAEEHGDSRLYRNTGHDEPRFEDVTRASGLAGLPRVSGAYFADYDNDGCPDLLVLRNHLPSLLWHNDCKGTFTDVTESSGLHRSGVPATGATWFDYDLDGHLDLYLILTGRFDRGYLPSRGDVWNAEPNVLWRNRGDGTFEDVTEKSGVGERGLALAVAATDFDADGDPDLYIANDMQRNVLFENRGDGTFRDVARQAGVDDVGNGMGVSVGDVDHDGLVDLYVTNVFRSPNRSRATRNRPRRGDRSIQSNRLYLNGGDGTFRDAHEELIEPAPLGWGWDSFFFDYDNDGFLDIYVINGFRPDYAPYQHEQNLLLRYDPEERRYRNVSDASGVGIRSASRAGVYFDPDGDGDLDLVVTGVHQPRFFRNDTKPGRHWLRVALVGSSANRDGFGARVRVSAQGRTQTLEMGNQGGGFISSIHGPLHFGLGAAKRVESVTVHWPGGGIQELEDVAVDQRIVIEQEQ